MSKVNIQVAPEEALISAILQGRREISFLVGSPLSMPDYPKGPGVPSVQGVLDIILEHVRNNNLEEDYKKYIADYSGGQGYQKAFAFLLSWLGQEHINKVVEMAVLRARVTKEKPLNILNPDLDVEGWYLPRGIRALGDIIAKFNQFQGPMLTTNFDPLLAIAIKASGGEPLQTVLHTDGSIGDHRALSERHRHVIHLHGYWRDSDTLHTPDQLTINRPKLKASLSRLISEKKLVVVGYGGWDDIFISSLRELMDDERSALDVLWAFRETDTETILNKYDHLLKAVEPARVRGRFRMYGGIECNHFFESLRAKLINTGGGASQNFNSTFNKQVETINNYVNKGIEEENKFCDPNEKTVSINEFLSVTDDETLTADINIFEEWHPLKSEAHFQVRAVEQAQFLEILESERVVFLSADWGLGKDGFISSALSIDNSPLMGSKLFRLDLEGVTDRDGLLAAAENQLGAPIQVFAIAASKLDRIALILDGVGFDSGLKEESSWPSDLEDVISALVDFVPSLRIILIGRREMPSYKFPSVELSPFDEPDARNYILNHQDGGSGLISGDAFDIIFRLSRGVPMQIDRLLSELTVVSVEELLESETGSVHETGETVETIPVALERAVKSLEVSEADLQRRSFYLLKVLSVLAHGEPFGNIKRFDNFKPFYPSQIKELRDLGLLESTSVVSAVPTPVTSGVIRPAREAGNKIHFVPPQVREYIIAKLTQDEIVNIVKRAAEITFGHEWRQGTIKLSPAAREHLKDHTRPGPGNAHLIIVHLLKQAIETGDENLLNSSLKLGSSYCSLLKANSRFRDLVSASKELLLLANDIKEHASIPILLKLCGEGLRMTGRHEEAIHEFEKALGGIGAFDKDEISDISLSLALAYRSIGDLDAAAKAAKDVRKYEKPGSGRYLHASSILIEYEKNDGYEESLKRIEKKARRTNHFVVANNILLNIADNERDQEKQFNIYNTIINCNEDDYNQIRAVIKKGIIMSSNLSLHEMSCLERRLISRAYAFSFTQRFYSLFNDSHKVLWALLEDKGDRPGLFQLFRYSSLIWRLKGESSREQNYAEKLRLFLAGDTGHKEDSSLAAQIARYVRIRIRIISEVN
jgi:tetratricopeptide (TPR) repeat protein